ncbi:unnamed protein product [Linum tenue]|uniref:Uncharacterized protein n=1 Tax=Linum tenue TaxID=586396 RepID=A0AAV0KF68_9ROSI|nr:unnamed protein product [Linum tenue]
MGNHSRRSTGLGIYIIPLLLVVLFSLPEDKMVLVGAARAPSAASAATVATSSIGTGDEAAGGGTIVHEVRKFGRGVRGSVSRPTGHGNHRPSPCCY